MSKMATKRKKKSTNQSNQVEALNISTAFSLYLSRSLFKKKIIKKVF